MGSFQQACDILRRLGDTNALAAALVESGAWNEALALAKQHPALGRDVFLPYARWLAEQEQFVEAQQGETLKPYELEQYCILYFAWHITLINFISISILRGRMFGRSRTSTQYTCNECRSVEQVRRRVAFLLALRQTSPAAGRQSVSLE